MTRTFEYKDAVRHKVQLLVSLVGVSSAGKTFSALRLATGIQRVVGGEIAVIDTENGRATHYSDRFSFKEVPFASPFDPDSYLAALETCIAQGAKTIIVDSGSHCWEGSGGVLEMHEAELDRRAGDDWKKREKLNFAAWKEPKQRYQRLVNTMLQMPAHMVWCFRAKSKLKPGKGPDGKSKMIDMGFMSIAGVEMMYEFALQCLLYPDSGGVPTWKSDLPGERVMIKLPVQFRDLFLRASKPLDEDTGEALARWAEGDDEQKEVPDAAAVAAAFAALLTEMDAAETLEAFTSASAKLKGHVWTEEQRKELTAKYKERKEALTDAPA